VTAALDSRATAQRTEHRSMRLLRRSLLSAAAGASLLAGHASAQSAPAADPRLGERAAGRPDAPVRVMEFFSLTCTHCAAFYRETLP
jgi:protein-disulfide isomerase